MNANSEDWVIVGRLGKPHGLKGLITIHSFTHPRDNILTYKGWHAFINNQWRPLSVLNASTNAKHILATLEGITDRDKALTLTNVDIAIRKGQLPLLEEDEFYWHELIGMKVINLQNEVLGTVVELLSTGSNDVLVVEGDKRHLIPYLPDRYISQIDRETKTIQVDWDLDF